MNIRERIVRPSLADIEVLDVLYGITSPKLLRRDESSWWHDAAGRDHATFLETCSFTNYASFADVDVVFDVARVERAVCANYNVVANFHLGSHAGG